MQLSGRRALVTGGGTGIGLAITRSLFRAGVDVVIVGRDAERLESVQRSVPRVSVIAADLSTREGRLALIEEILTQQKPIDLLVNNAGIMQYFDLATPSAQSRLDRELELNLHAPIELCTAILPSLLSRREAAIVNVTTGLVYAPFGATPGYSASKAGLHAFTRSIRWQTRKSSLHVLELQPPAVATELTDNYNGTKVDATVVAEALVQGLRRRTPEVRPGQSKALYVMSRVALEFIFRALNKQADTTPLDA